MGIIKNIHFLAEGISSNLVVPSEQVDWSPVVGEQVTIRMADGHIVSGVCTKVHLNYAVATLEIIIRPEIK